MTIRFKRSGQVSSIFITSSVDHIAGYDGSGSGIGAYSFVELYHKIPALPEATGIMVIAKTVGTTLNGWSFIVGLSDGASSVGVVGTVVTASGYDTLGDLYAGLIGNATVTASWHVIQLETYNAATLLGFAAGDGHGAVTNTTAGGQNTSAGSLNARYRKADGIWRHFDGTVVATTGHPEAIPGSFVVNWLAAHLDQIGDLELHIPAASGRDPTNRYYEVKSLPDGVLWEGYVVSGAGGGVITFGADLDDVIATAGDDNTLARARVHVIRGTGIGQTLLVSTNDASARTVTLFSDGYNVGPLDSTSYVAIMPGGAVDVGAWGGLEYATARPEVDVAKWKGSTPSNLGGGGNHVQTYVAEVANDAITAAAIANDAIDASAIAAGAIDLATFTTDFLDALGVVRRNTATAGAASTITLDASASATDNTYRGQLIYLYSGTGAPQSRLITGYVGATKVATVFPAWTTQPINGTTFIVFAWSGQLENGAITSSTFAASAIAAAAIATGAITSAKFAAGAIDAAAIASNAITSAKIATDAIDANQISPAAVTKIQNGVATAANLATVAGYIDTEIATIIGHVDTLEASATTLLANTAAGAIAAAVLDAVAASYADAGSIGEAIQTGSAPTAVENAEALMSYAFRTGRTVRGFFRRADALFFGKVTGLLGALVTAFRPGGIVSEYTVAQDVVAGNRAESDVAGSETP